MALHRKSGNIGIDDIYTQIETLIKNIKLLIKKMTLINQKQPVSFFIDEKEGKKVLKNVNRQGVPSHNVIGTFHNYHHLR